MKKSEKMEVLAQPSVAYASMFGGVEIKRFDYGINGSIVFVVGAWCSKPEVHKSRIYCTAKSIPFFTYKGCRISLSDCIRI